MIAQKGLSEFGRLLLCVRGLNIELKPMLPSVRNGVSRQSGQIHSCCALVKSLSIRTHGK